ncbi:MAG: DUF4159 domain-containing protein [Alphaproteobacteria bacterium]|nr:MAG: DUF4159 domain-containing protein [Alphaproteobacteria bacterium]
MFSLGGITFLSPFLLAAIAGIPVLWWILRVMPPRPRSIKFPAFFLLKGLQTDIKTAAHTPWWLLLLRSLIIALFILSMADPVLRLSGGLPGKGPVLIAVDNGWSAAAHWQERQDKLKEFVTMFKRADRAVVFLPTAPDAQDGKMHASSLMKADDAEQWVDHMKPWPWPRDPEAAAKTAQEIIQQNHISYAVYLSDGTGDNPSDTAKFLAALQSSGGLTLLNDEKVNTPFILRRTASRPGDVAFSLERLREAAANEPMVLAAYTADGDVLDTYKFSFPAGKKTTDIKWDLLSEMRSKIARFGLESPQMASAVSLTDSQWRQHPVGIVADPSRKDNAGFLNEVYYLRRALEVNGAPEIEQPGALLEKSLSAIIWPDSAALTSIERHELLKWVQDGGFLIRFAGPNLSGGAEDDPLVPVHLRYGERAMAGAMTWEKPAKLGPIAQHSPLYGLDVPTDVTVSRQLLADPTPEVFEKTWLQLEDGTPLMTGGNIGKGFVVLIHTTAGPDWSDFCYSGLYVEALQRMISLSAGISDYKADTVLPPLMVMDGFGRLQPPDRHSVIGSVDPHQDFKPSPATPPGLYGDDRQFRVYNLGDSLGDLQALKGVPSSVDVQTYALSGEKSLKADFLKWALWLLALDTLLTLWLRGLFGGFVRAGATFAFALVLVTAPAQADVTPADLASGIYLGYIETGDRDADQVSFNGLFGLMKEINARTTIKVRGVQNVNPESDVLFYYPFLYWPMTDAQPELSVAAARNIQNYLGRGGMILFDTRDQQFGNLNSATLGTKKLRQLTRNIQIPELVAVAPGHILGKTFYLLDDFPGLYTGGKIWVEKEPSPSYDSITSVVIGGNDWAAAWSRDGSDRARFLVRPGGEDQRKMAYRFGVNLLMMALAGNYKSDQVHVPYILERLHRQ